MQGRYSSYLPVHAAGAVRLRVLPSETPVKFRRLLLILVTALIAVSACGCNADDRRSVARDGCALALTAHSGNGDVDREIVRLQQAVPSAYDKSGVLEQLGWAYIKKARVSYDPGFYKLAEQCAICIESWRPDSPEALLLRGHVLDSLHQFKEAEAIARRLSETRGAPFDYGLLGDTLMEQGRLNEAIQAYQKMIDLKPGPQAYTRVAHIRWLKGDLEGAIEMMRKAAAGISPRDAESAAWAYTRLALYELQAGSAMSAERACEIALGLQNDYAPALLARSRVLLSENRYAEAAQIMRQAARINPLPEYQWLLAEALRAAGGDDDARAVEDKLKETGAAEDPRTFALFLATRGEQPDLALTLIEKEIRARDDVFTLDALAWALAASGRLNEARQPMQLALAEGTIDARLFYHAGSIAAMNGLKQEARLMLNRAATIKQMLLPSEREELSRALAKL